MTVPSRQQGILMRTPEQLSAPDFTYRVRYNFDVLSELINSLYSQGYLYRNALGSWTANASGYIPGPPSPVAEPIGTAGGPGPAGPVGPPGPAPPSFLFGAEEPALTLGKPGDVYFQTTGTIWAKTALSFGIPPYWHQVINLAQFAPAGFIWPLGTQPPQAIPVPGPAGMPGIPGPQGPQGIQGTSLPCSTIEPTSGLDYVEWTGLSGNSWDLAWAGLALSSGSASLLMQCGYGPGPTWSTGATDYTTFGSQGSQITVSTSCSTGCNCNGAIRIYQQQGSGAAVLGNYWLYNGSAFDYSSLQAQWYVSGNPLTAIRLYFGSETFAGTGGATLISLPT